MAKVTWHGDEIAAKFIAASKLAVDQTTAAAVVHAKDHHEFQNISGTLEGSLQMRPAELQGSQVVGQWGSMDVLYAAFQELMAGETGFGITRSQQGGHPFLRPAADAEYPNLMARLRAALMAVSV